MKTYIAVCFSNQSDNMKTVVNSNMTNKKYQFKIGD